MLLHLFVVEYHKLLNKLVVELMMVQLLEETFPAVQPAPFSYLSMSLMLIRMVFVQFLMALAVEVEVVEILNTVVEFVAVVVQP
jgi:hypothetical protein